MDVEQVGMNARVKIGDSRSNSFRDTRLPHFVRTTTTTTTTPTDSMAIGQNLCIIRLFGALGMCYRPHSEFSFVLLEVSVAAAPFLLVCQRYLPLDEPVASAVFIIVSGSDERAGGKDAFGAS